ncbi:MAG: hypothetical protein ABJL55_21585 [Roseibium sp.]
MVIRKLNIPAFAALGLGLIGFPINPAWSQEMASAISLELNKAEDTETKCRLSFVMSNRTGQTIASASYELVLFSKDNIIHQMSVFDFGYLPVAKTVVRQFELSSIGCSDSSRLLVNGPAGCSGDPTSPHCSAPLSLSSRTGLDLTQ